MYEKVNGRANDSGHGTDRSRRATDWWGRVGGEEDGASRSPDRGPEMVFHSRGRVSLNSSTRELDVGCRAPERSVGQPRDIPVDGRNTKFCRGRVLRAVGKAGRHWHRGRIHWEARSDPGALRAGLS